MSLYVPGIRSTARKYSNVRVQPLAAATGSTLG